MLEKCVSEGSAWVAGMGLEILVCLSLRLVAEECETVFNASVAPLELRKLSADE